MSEQIHVLLYPKGGYCLRIGSVPDLISDEMEDLVAVMLEKGLIDEETANSEIITKAIESVKSAKYEFFDDRRKSLDRTDEWRKSGGEL